MSFKKNKYTIIKKIISKELVNFIYEYFLLKRNVVYYLYNQKNIAENKLLGTWNDQQVPNTYSIYSDMVMETLLKKILITMEKKTKLKLIPTYSYARIYKKNDVLEKHKDRESCEISTTLNLGGDVWPIFIKNLNNKKIKIVLKPGDMLIYSGCELEHWREPFKGENCAQVFLHYNNLNGKFKNLNKFDKRPMLGFPFI